MHKIFKSIILFVITLLIMGHVPTTYACSCAAPRFPKEILNESVAVFAGKVISIEEPQGNIINTADPVKVTLEISRFWKGSNEKLITLSTPRSGVSCGYHFEKDQEYLVYAHYGEKNDLETGLCTGNKLLSEAGRDIEELNQVQSTNTPSASKKITQPIYILPASLILVLGIYLIIRRRTF